MDPIMDFARANSIKVLEDCAQAHGAIYRGRKVGSIGDVAAWSFCQDKIISTGGEGGMVTTNNMELWRFMWAYKDHGKNIDLALGRQRTTEFRWLHDSFGTNYRLTEMQAAIGRVQLRRLAEWTMLRNRNARVILDACRDTTLVRTPSLSGCSCNGSGKNRTCESLCCVHAYYRCYVYIRKERLKVGWSRDRILRVLNEQGVLCNQGSCSEVYLEKAFIETALSPPHQLKNAKELGESSIAFMVHPTLTMHSMAEMSLIIVNVLSEASN